MTATGKENVAALVEAVQSGDLPLVRGMLQSRPELIHKDLAANDECRALHFAVLRRDAPMVKLLMEAGADARKGVYPHRSATSAHTLAQEREYDEIAAIIEEAERSRQPGEDRSEAATPPSETDTSVRTAIQNGDVSKTAELVAAKPQLLSQIDPYKGGLLTVAVRSGQLAVVEKLLSIGADVDERVHLKELEEPTLSWGMPLWHAAMSNNYEIVKLLLERGADPNGNVYASGWPIRNASNHPDGAVKRLLLDSGAKLPPYMIQRIAM